MARYTHLDNGIGDFSRPHWKPEAFRYIDGSVSSEFVSRYDAPDMRIFVTGGAGFLGSHVCLRQGTR
jgi:hypothetical protein